jgi:AAHS family 3-hydroxyphenylpropionic acid transporter
MPGATKSAASFNLETTMNTSTASPRVGGGITIGLCLAVALLEGLDLQSTGIAAPRMAREFHLAVAQLGWAFGIGALGLLPGAALAAARRSHRPQARADDVRRAVRDIFDCNDPGVGSASLLVARFLTGLGLGAAMPNLIALCAEAAPPRQRSTAVGAMYCGMPFGAALAAVIGIVSPGAEGWRQIFYVGGIGPLLTLPLLALCLKESTQFAAASQGAAARRRTASCARSSATDARGRPSPCGSATWGR